MPGGLLSSHAWTLDPQTCVHTLAPLWAPISNSGDCIDRGSSATWFLGQTSSSYTESPYSYKLKHEGLPSSKSRFQEVVC